MTDGWLDGQRTLVVGGASGIGRGVVDAFVSEGAEVSVLDQSAPLLASLVESHPKVLVHQADATDWAAVSAAVEGTVAAFGALDTLVCTAGVFDYFRPLESIEGEELGPAFDEIFASNVKSSLLAARAAIPHLAAAGGSIVLTLSTAAMVTDCGGALYAATKWAARGLVASLAHELAPAIRVNGVAPGGTAGTNLSGLTTLGQSRSVTDIADRDERIRASTPLGISLLPDDHAGAYVYLASAHRARGVTGTVVVSDGGRSIAGVDRLAGRSAPDPYSGAPRPRRPRPPTPPAALAEPPSAAPADSEAAPPLALRRSHSPPPDS